MSRYRPSGMHIDPNVMRELQSLGEDGYTALPGEVKMWAGATAPAGWLFCDGSALDRVAYADLFAAIGTTWGAPSGTTFSLPDLRGRVPLGAGTGTGLTTRTLGATGGTENAVVAAHSHSHSHTTPSHSHTTPAHSHSHSHGASSGTVSADHDHSMSHYHTASIGNVLWTGNTTHTHSSHGGFAAEGADPSSGTATSVPVNVDTLTSNTGGANANHTHSVTVNADATTAAPTTDGAAPTTNSDATSSGVSGTDQNVPPWAGLNFIIKV